MLVLRISGLSFFIGARERVLGWSVGGDRTGTGLSFKDGVLWDWERKWCTASEAVDASASRYPPEGSVTRRPCLQTGLEKDLGCCFIGVMAPSLHLLGLGSGDARPGTGTVTSFLRLGTWSSDILLLLLFLSVLVRFSCNWRGFGEFGVNLDG